MKPIAIVMTDGDKMIWEPIPPPKWDPWRSPIFLLMVITDVVLFFMMVW